MNPSNIIPFPTGAVAAEPIAQPSPRSPETADKICAAVRRHGLSDSACAALAGVTAGELARWRQEDADFAHRLDAARAELHEELVDRIRQAKNRDGSPNKQAQAWLRKHGYLE